MSGTDRVHAKLVAALKRGEHYEALQMYRTVVARRVAQKKMADALQLLDSGMRTLLEHKQWSCASDLGMMLIDVLDKAGTSLEEGGAMLLPLVQLFPSDDNAGPLKVAFLRAALKWTKAADPEKIGMRPLYDELGKLYATSGAFAEAERCLVNGQDSAAMAQVLLAWSRLGNSWEAPLFMLRAGLRAIAKDNPLHANNFTHELRQLNPSIKDSQHEVFLLLLLDLVSSSSDEINDADKGALCSYLTNKYEPILRADPELGMLVSQISQKHFGTVAGPAPRGGPGGAPFNIMDIMRPLMQGGAPRQ